MRGQYSGSIYLARRSALEWRRLLRSVITLIKTMPLWKLQVIGRSVDDFIYRQGHLENGSIELRTGVHASFRSFHGLITNLIRGGWLTQVRRIAGNRDLLGEQAEKSKAHTWLRKDDYPSLDGSWRVAMGGLRAVAEVPAGYD